MLWGLIAHFDATSCRTHTLGLLETPRVRLHFDIIGNYCSKEFILRIPLSPESLRIVVLWQSFAGSGDPRIGPCWSIRISTAFAICTHLPQLPRMCKASKFVLCCGSLISLQGSTLKVRCLTVDSEITRTEPLEQPLEQPVLRSFSLFEPM